jgi:hypothetical protein
MNYNNKVNLVIKKSKSNMNLTQSEGSVLSHSDTETSTKNIHTVRKEGLDKFYTVPNVVDTCVSSLAKLYQWNAWDLIVEPSAGNGSFLLKIPSEHKIGMDIVPEHSSIIKQDFFSYSPPQNKKHILVIGNPPFGKVSSLAIRFFNHASQWANVIAFVIPRTFRRNSVQNKLNRDFHLVLDLEVPTNPCSFHPPMMVKCCFQIWEKKNIPRIVVKLDTKHPDWEFLPFGPLDTKGQPTPPVGADFAIRAYGGKCGEIKNTGLEQLRPKSWHWIKANIEVIVLIQRFQHLDYSNSKNTARQNSIGRGELVSLYTHFIDIINAELH